MTKRIVVVASGRGSNFQAIIGALERGRIPAQCVALVTDNPKAYAIERATRREDPGRCRRLRCVRNPGTLRAGAPCRTQRDKAGPCGARRVHAHPRVVNCPGICREDGSISTRRCLPSFTGLHAQRQALEHGVKVAGCTVHFVDESLDGGPIILQRCVRVMDDDDEDTLANRILIQEHIALPEAVRLFCEDRLTIEGRKVRVRM